MAAVKKNSVEAFLLLLSKDLANYVAKNDDKTAKLHSRIVLNLLKPFSEGGSNMTPEEVFKLIETIEARPEHGNAVGFSVTPKAGGFFGGGLVGNGDASEDDDEIDEDEDGSEEEDEEDEDEDYMDDSGVQAEVLPAPSKRMEKVKNNRYATAKIPLLLPVKHDNGNDFAVQRSNRSCKIDFSLLSRMEMPKNERNLNLMEQDTLNTNTVLHICNSTRHRQTFESRFMATCLLALEPRLEQVKNSKGQTPNDCLNAKSIGEVATKFGKSLSLNVSPLVDKVVKDWLEKMEAKNNERKKKESADAKEAKMLEPDRRFASYSISKIVKDAKTDRPYNVLMTKIDLGNQGRWAEFNFYQLQLIQLKTTSLFVVFTRWGRIGTDGMYQQTPFRNFDDAYDEFCKIFKQKSGNDWKKITSDADIVAVPKKYQLVTLDRPNRFSQLGNVKIDMKFTSKSSLDADVYETVKHIIDSSLLNINNGTLYRHLSNIHLTPFGLVSQESLQQALTILQSIDEKITELNGPNGNRHHFHHRFGRRFRPPTSNQQTPEVEQRSKLWKEIAQLSEKYFHIVPRSGFVYAEVHPLNDQNVVKAEMKKLDFLLNFQAATRVLLGAHKFDNKHNPCDFVLDYSGTMMKRIDGNSREANDILQYISASWNPAGKNEGVEAIYALDRPNERETMEGLKLDNRRLLWHGTKSENLLGILSSGLQILPEGVQHTGQLHGSGVYLSDTFRKAMNYCDSVHGKPSFVLLCDVALGKCQLTSLNYFSEEALRNLSKDKFDTLISLSMSQLPDPRFTATFDENAKSLIPFGGLINTQRGHLPAYHHGFFGSQQGFTEYIVQNPKQINIKYLIQLRQ